MTAASSHPAIPATPPALGPERSIAWPSRTVRTLSNGMQVVLAEQRTFPKIGVELFFAPETRSFPAALPTLLS